MSLQKRKNDNEHIPCTTQNNTYKSFGLNLRLLLFLQSFGLNAAAARSLSTCFGLTNYVCPFGNYSKMKETIGLTKIELSKENISMNVEKEMELSLTDTENG